MRLTPLLLLPLAACGPGRSGPQPAQLVVLAAASTTVPLHEIAAAFERREQVAVRLNLNASSTLARQIEAGAPADVFISANAEWMDRLEAEGLIDPGSRVELLSNRLVVVVPRGTERPGAPPADLRTLLSGLTALGDPEHVPAGRYARAALERLGVWDGLRVVATIDVRAALRLAEMGEVDAAVVYRSDAAGSERVVVAAEIDPGLHERIAYPVARLRRARPEADAFLRYLRGPEAAAIFERAGFLPAEAAGAP
jgi:molybdate transport system substrate-binding protein